MGDEDCTMWTLGSFCEPPIKPYEVFEITNVMAGPSHSWENISKMVVELKLGDGKFFTFHSSNDALAFMLRSMADRFAFGVSNGDRVGHMINAYKSVDNVITFRDYQIPPHKGQVVNPPEGENTVYTIWPIF